MAAVLTEVRAALQIMPHRALITSPSKFFCALSLYLAMLPPLVIHAVKHPEKVTSTLKLLVVFHLSWAPLSPILYPIHLDHPSSPGKSWVFCALYSQTPSLPKGLPIHPLSFGVKCQTQNSSLLLYTFWFGGYMLDFRFQHKLLKLRDPTSFISCFLWFHWLESFN